MENPSGTATRRVAYRQRPSKTAAGTDGDETPTENGPTALAGGF